MLADLSSAIMLETIFAAMYGFGLSFIQQWALLSLPLICYESVMNVAVALYAAKVPEFHEGTHVIPCSLSYAPFEICTPRRPGLSHTETTGILGVHFACGSNCTPKPGVCLSLTNQTDRR